MVFVLAALPFVGAVGHGFVEWDDYTNLVENESYRGFSPEHLAWMFSNFTLGVYQPLPWLTYALDHALWGMDPMGYHLTNVLLHGAAAAALFAALRAALARREEFASRPLLHVGIAAGGALLWAVHPLRVESVAWATERRDVLSGLFLFLTLRAWVAHVDDDRGLGRSYWLAVLAFAATMLSKASAMGLPIVLVLLDRLLGRRRTLRASVVEKLPLFAVSAAVAWIAWVGQADTGTVSGFGELTPLDRVMLAGHSTAFYAFKCVVPMELRAHYARSAPFDPWETRLVLATAATIAVTVLVTLRSRRWFGATVAWWSYLLLLAPVSGLTQTGSHLVADRYSYQPTSALFVGIAVAIGLEMARVDKFRLRRAQSLWIATLVGVGGLSAHLTMTWKDTPTLFERVLRFEPDNWLANEQIGRMAAREGRPSEAIPYLERSLAAKRDPDTAITLAQVRAGLGEFVEARRLIDLVLEIEPDRPEALNVLGTLQARDGDLAGARRTLLRARDLKPGDSMVHHNLGEVAFALGDHAAAEEHYREALRVNPDNAKAKAGLARVERR